MNVSQRAIKSKVKDKQLVDLRRRDIANAAVGLVIKQGYHQTTVREIAKEFGMSMGALYDYIRTKEDILFLVCDYIHRAVSSKLGGPAAGNGNALENLKVSIREYYTIIDEIQDHMLLLYQETKSLNKRARRYIYSAELELTSIFENLLNECIEEESISIDKTTSRVVAHNIMVSGQMWAFRRWSIQKDYTLNTYTNMQIELILNGIV